MTNSKTKHTRPLILVFIGMITIEVAHSAEKTVAGELAAIVPVADTQVKEGSASLEDFLKVQIAVNFAQYKVEEISKDDLKRLNEPLEKRLIYSARVAYQRKQISVNELLATIDFISNHR